MKVTMLPILSSATQPDTSHQTPPTNPLTVPFDFKSMLKMKAKVKVTMLPILSSATQPVKPVLKRDADNFASFSAPPVVVNIVILL